MSVRDHVDSPSLSSPAGARKVTRILAITLALLLAVETALQLRSQVRSGQSVFTLLSSGTSYIYDDKTGLKLLRPNRIFAGESVTLRSPEIPLERTPGSWRLAVIGASTVMGLYDRDTDTSFPARLEQRLRREFPHRRIDVVNAGIMGYGLDDQRRMLETRVAALHPDLTVVYTGFNDFTGYCQDKEARTAQFQRHGLPLVEMPPWLFTVDNIRKKTVFLRTTAVRQTTMKNPDDLDLQPYRARLEALVRRAEELHLPLALSTNARAYRRDQPIDEQLQLSRSARYFNGCFDLDSLHVLYDRHNAVIREVAAAHRIRSFPSTSSSPAARATSSMPSTSPRSGRRAGRRHAGGLHSQVPAAAEMNLKTSIGCEQSCLKSGRLRFSGRWEGSPDG